MSQQHFFISWLKRNRILYSFLSGRRHGKHEKDTSVQWFVVLSNVTANEWKMLISLSFIEELVENMSTGRGTSVKQSTEMHKIRCIFSFDKLYKVSC